MTTTPKNAAFMRSLCMGEILEDMIFPFPKLPQEQSDTLKTVLEAVRVWLKSKEKDFRKWDEKGELPKEILQEIREMGLFGLVIPEQYGGLGFSSTAYSRTLQEIASFDASVAITVGAHSSIGMRGLLLFGTDEQKARYAPKLATGEIIAAFCLTEPGAGSDAAGIKTKAVRKGDGFVLNGEKLWITNGGIADFFTVFARTDEEPGGQISAFIVTKDMGGVTIGPHEDKMGIRASSTTTVHFENTFVPAANVLGEIGKGFKLAMKILNVGRTGLGGGCIGAMKQVIRLASTQAKGRQQFGKPISEFGLIKQKIGHMVVECYAAESTVSMVAGLSDKGYEDYAVESAISKVFATEACWRTIDEGLQIAAGNGFMREFPYERILRDARINRIFEGTNEILRLFIALTAMAEVGQNLKEVQKSFGNVFTDPIKGFGVLSDYALKRVTQATGLGQAEFTKASSVIREQCTIFEDCTRDLSGFVDEILRKHGKKIVDNQFATRRLADAMIDLFPLACVISRVSAAIAEKGEKNCQREIEILKVFSGQVRRRVKGNFSKLHENDDNLISSLADHTYQEERYTWDNI